MCLFIGFRIELSNVNIIKDAFESISKIVDEVKMVIDEEGFKVNALDRSHIVFVGLKLEPSVFEEYDIDVSSKIFIDTVDFMKIIKRANKSHDRLILSYNDDNDLIIIFEGDTSRTFKIRLIDVEYDSPEPPSLSPPCSFAIESALLKDCLIDMELFSDVLSYKIDEEYFIAFTDGEFGDSTFKYLHGENINEVVKSSFSIPKLKEIMSASKFSPMVEVYLGNDMPVILNYTLETGDGHLKFLLAPRLDAEDE